MPIELMVVRTPHPVANPHAHPYAHRTDGGTYTSPCGPSPSPCGCVCVLQVVLRTMASHFGNFRDMRDVGVCVLQVVLGTMASHFGNFREMRDVGVCVCYRWC